MRRLIAPLTALLAPRRSRRAAAHAGVVRRRRRRRPGRRSTRWATSTSPATARAGVVYLKRDAGVAAGLPLAPGRGRLAAAGEALERRAGHRGGRDRDRRRPAGRGLGRRRRGVGDRRSRRPRGPRRPRRRCVLGGGGATRRRDRHGHQRGRLRRLVGGRRRPRRAPGRHAPGRRSPAPLDVDPARTAGDGPRCARASPSAPRATRSPPGRETDANGRSRVVGAPPHRPDAVLVPAGPHAGRFDGAARRQRRLAGHRHRGRRLVRLGRLPPGRRRALADRRRGGCAARCSRTRSRSTAASRARARGSTSPARASAARSSAADGNAVFSAYLDKFDAFQPGAPLDATPSSAAPAPVVATSERGDVYVAWRTGAGDGGDVRARRKDGEKGFEPEFVASDPAFGAVAPGPARDRRRPLRQHRRRDAPGHRRRARASPPRSTTARPAAPVIAQLDPLPRAAAADQLAAGLGDRGARRRSRCASTARCVGKTTANALVSPRALGTGTAPLPGHGDRPPRPGRDAAARGRSGSTRACRRCRITVRRSGPPRHGLDGARATAAPAGLDHVQIDCGDGSRKLARAAARVHSLQARPLHAEGHRGRQGRQRDRQEQGAADPVTAAGPARGGTGAAARAAAADGHRQRDARLVLRRRASCRAREARLARGRALLAAGRRHPRRRRRVRARRPARGGGRGGDRARGAA